MERDTSRAAQVDWRDLPVTTTESVAGKELKEHLVAQPHNLFARCWRLAANQIAPGSRLRVVLAAAPVPSTKWSRGHRLSGRDLNQLSC